MDAAILGIETYLPGDPVRNAELAAGFPEWDVERISKKTGIEARHIAAPGELASDLAYAAAEKLFAGGACTAADIDYVLLCTQSPDHVLPTTACLLQQRLGISKNAGAVDFNLGCSGYVYGLGLAQGLIATGQARRVLLLAADTYSKYIRPDDRSAVMIFGDAGTATLVGSVEDGLARHEAVYTYGSDGSGAQHLMVKSAGLRALASETGSDADGGPGTLG